MEIFKNYLLVRIGNLFFSYIKISDGNDDEVIVVVFV
jgi:hypothetical protein